jgi:hypothetical protein
MTALAVEAIVILTAKYGPLLAQQFVTLLHKKDVTLDDWNALFAQVKSYEEIMADVPQSGLGPK